MTSKSFENKLDMIDVLENMSEACYFLNSNWEFEFINRAAEPYLKVEELFFNKSKEELIGKSVWDVSAIYTDTEVYNLYHKVFEEQKPHVFEMISKYSKRWFEMKLFPNKSGLFIIFSDITDRKESEKIKAHYEKLNVIGEMAAGVAHEIRNPLTSVKGFLQLMAENQELIKQSSVVHLMIDEVNRVNDIITEFLDIAKVKPEKVEICCLNELITTIFPLLETRASKEGKLVDLDLSKISELQIDKSEIRQLLLNLVNNSLDAMHVGKKVIIKTYEEKGETVLTIIDEGTGIPAEIIGNIETPFVTSKDEGTGLGIPICFSIAKRNNAKIDYTSSPKGTTFNIRFTNLPS
ncbi:two-component system sensor histidine kinase NtrB [Salipaludibacillus daqingensis]|uniref:two-component system sensor histidine kinase NtrB n=1 Tax=Salipaludibacillus daqingensis TaxID=3041001 RepID=UPI002473A372|nr:ATP-binding protein [Salipaludibacillus daqingensis]